MIQRVIEIIKKYWKWMVGFVVLSVISISSIFRLKRENPDQSKNNHDEFLRGQKNIIEIKAHENNTIEKAHSEAREKIYQIEEDYKKRVDELSSKDQAELTKELAERYGIKNGDIKP